MATKKDALPKDWRQKTEKLLKDYARAPQALFTGQDPLSRATLPSTDVHRRKKEKDALRAVTRKSVQILESVDPEAAAALLKAEMRERRKAGNDVLPGTWRQGIWCRALAYGILFVARLSYWDERVGPPKKKRPREPLRISAEEAKRTAAALKVVRRNAERYLIQDPDEIEDGIKYLESSVHSARGRRKSRTTYAIKTLASYYQQAVHDPVHVATAALIRASFGVEMTNDSVRSIAYRCLKKSKSGE